MEGQHLRVNSLLQYRFRKMLFTLRLVGIPLIHPMSSARTVYNGIFVMCFYISYCGCLMVLLFNTYGLQGMMKNIRALIGLQLIVWIHFFFR